MTPVAVNNPVIANADEKVVFARRIWHAKAKRYIYPKNGSVFVFKVKR